MIIPSKLLIKKIRCNHFQKYFYSLSTLKNGLKVASLPQYGPVSAIGLFINAGSRYTVDYPSGITHLLKKMAFQSCNKYANLDEIQNVSENICGQLDSDISRDMAVYGATVHHSNLGQMVELLSDVVVDATFKDSDINKQINDIIFELEGLPYLPDRENEFLDHIHASAFRQNTLGLPLVTNAKDISNVNSQLLSDYVKRYFLPNRSALVAINVNHNEFVEYVEKYFGKWNIQVEDKKIPDNSIAQYTGGLITIHEDGPRKQPGHTMLPELSYLSIGFEGVNDSSPLIYPSAVLYSLLGSGKSFSAGGPGKGLFTRLNMDVLGSYHWVNSCSAYNISFIDSGLFAIHGSCIPSQIRNFVNVILKQYYQIIEQPITEEELSRAKRQLQSVIMMNLESRAVLLEDLGRQVLVRNKWISSEIFYNLIEKVTVNDIKEVCSLFLNSKPSVAALGNLDDLPTFDEISNAISKRTTLPKKMFSFSKFSR